LSPSKGPFHHQGKDESQGSIENRLEKKEGSGETDGVVFYQTTISKTRSWVRKEPPPQLRGRGKGEKQPPHSNIGKDSSRNVGFHHVISWTPGERGGEGSREVLVKVGFSILSDRCLK